MPRKSFWCQKSQKLKPRKNISVPARAAVHSRVLCPTEGKLFIQSDISDIELMCNLALIRFNIKHYWPAIVPRYVPVRMRPGWSPPSYLNGGDQGEEEEGEKQDIVGGEHFHRVVARFPWVWQKFCVRASSFKNLQSWPASQNTTDFLTFLIIFCFKYLGSTYKFHFRQAFLMYKCDGVPSKRYLRLLSLLQTSCDQPFPKFISRATAEGQ